MNLCPYSTMENSFKVCFLSTKGWDYTTFKANLQTNVLKTITIITFQQKERKNANPALIFQKDYIPLVLRSELHVQLTHRWYISAISAIRLDRLQFNAPHSVSPKVIANINSHGVRATTKLYNRYQSSLTRKKTLVQSHESSIFRNDNKTTSGTVIYSRQGR